MANTIGNPFGDLNKDWSEENKLQYNAAVLSDIYRRLGTVVDTSGVAAIIAPQAAINAAQAAINAGVATTLAYSRMKLSYYDSDKYWMGIHTLSYYKKIWLCGNGILVGNISDLNLPSITWSFFSSPSALNGISAVSPTNILTVGYSGLIYSFNGTTLTLQTSGTAQHLRGVTRASASVAWAVGDSGTILYTSNGGVTWTPQTSGTVNRLAAVVAKNASVAWAVGDSGTILYTSNGGVTWTPQTSGTTNDLISVQLTGYAEALATSYVGEIFYYDGANWSKIYPILVFDNAAFHLRLTTGYSGWVAQSQYGFLLIHDGYSLRNIYPDYSNVVPLGTDKGNVGIIEEDYSLRFIVLVVRTGSGDSVFQYHIPG